MAVVIRVWETHPGPLGGEAACTPSGTAITTGSNNVILGAHPGTPAMTNTVVLADGAGTVRARWDNTANAILGLDATVPSLTVNDTMSMHRDSVTGGINVAIRSGGVTTTLELRNERQIGSTVSSATSLSSVHRNRFTQVSAVATITLVAYTGIVLGSEHEFMSRCGTQRCFQPLFPNTSTGLVTFAGGSGVTVRSFQDKLNLSINGAAVVKYIGTNLFLLCGTLE